MVLIEVIAGFSAVCALTPLVGVDEVEVGVCMPDSDRLEPELVSLLEDSELSEVTLEVDVVVSCVVDAACALEASLSVRVDERLLDTWVVRDDEVDVLGAPLRV
jgi:hypothetical protein